MMLTVIVVSITKSDFHYHVVISKIVNITLFCSDVHYAVFTVYVMCIPSITVLATRQIILYNLITDLLFTILFNDVFLLLLCLINLH